MTKPSHRLSHDKTDILKKQSAQTDNSNMTDEPVNLPGYGAEQIASRASLRAERLKAEQFLGDPTDIVLKSIQQAERTRRNYSQGAEGERMVAQVLGSLQRYGWVALHDVHWPGRPKANIDHIAVGPGGVVIIDTKYWTGDVVLTPTKLSQNGYSRATQVTAVADAANAVAALLAPEHRLAVSAVLTLAAQNSAPTRLGATTVVGREELPTHLVTLAPKLSPYDVADVARFLHETLAGPQNPTLATTDLLNPKTKKRRTRRPRASKSAVVKKSSAPNRTKGKNGRKPQQRKAKSGGVEDLAKFLIFGGIAVWGYLHYFA